MYLLLGLHLWKTLGRLLKLIWELKILNRSREKIKYLSFAALCKPLYNLYFHLASVDTLYMLQYITINLSQCLKLATRVLVC